MESCVSLRGKEVSMIDYVKRIMNAENDCDCNGDYNGDGDARINKENESVVLERV